MLCAGADADAAGDGAGDDTATDDSEEEERGCRHEATPLGLSLGFRFEGKSALAAAAVAVALLRLDEAFGLGSIPLAGTILEVSRLFVVRGMRARGVVSGS